MNTCSSLRGGPPRNFIRKADAAISGVDVQQTRLPRSSPLVQKMQRILSLAMTAGGIALTAPSAHASASQLKKGNRLFKNGHYADAMKLYDDALVDQPNSSILHFNSGDAAYATGDFEKAQKEFDEAGRSALLPLQAASQYNLGNTLFRQQKWNEAIEAYKQTLRLNPKDENAKYNLGLAMNLLRNPPKASPQSSSGKGSQGKNGKKGAQKEQSQEKQAKAEQKKGGMSKEDADRLLAAVAASEPKKGRQKEASNPQIPHPDEDW